MNDIADYNMRRPNKKITFDDDWCGRDKKCWCDSYSQKLNRIHFKFNKQEYIAFLFGDILKHENNIRVFKVPIDFTKKDAESFDIEMNTVNQHSLLANIPLLPSVKKLIINYMKVKDDTCSSQTQQKYSDPSPESKPNF